MTDENLSDEATDTEATEAKPKRTISPEIMERRRVIRELTQAEDLLVRADRDIGKAEQAVKDAEAMLAEARNQREDIATAVDNAKRAAAEVLGLGS